MNPPPTCSGQQFGKALAISAFPVKCRLRLAFQDSREMSDACCISVYRYFFGWIQKKGCRHVKFSWLPMLSAGLA